MRRILVLLLAIATFLLAPLQPAKAMDAPQPAKSAVPTPSAPASQIPPAAANVTPTTIVQATTVPTPSSVPVAHASAPSDVKPIIPMTDAQAHYERLESFFHKLLGWTIGALTLIVTVGGLFFVSSMKEAKEAARAEASRAAVSQAQASVTEALKDQSLRKTIDDVVAREIGPAAKVETQKQLERVRGQMAEIVRISELAVMIRIGVGNSLIEMRSIAQSHDDAFIREIAHDAISSAEAELKRRWRADYDSLGTADAKRRNILQNAGFNDSRANPNDEQLIAGLYRNAVWRASAPNVSGYSIFFINLLTGQNLNLFDIEALKAWGDKRGLPRPPPVN